MTREQVLRLKQLAFKKFYSRPRYMVQQLLKVRSRYEFQALWEGLLSLGRLYFNPDMFIGHAALKRRFKGDPIMNSLLPKKD